MVVLFDEVAHEYRDERGRQYPSVTQVLKAGGICNFSFVGGDVRDAAMDHGTQVHRMLEFYDKKELPSRDRQKLSPVMKDTLRAWIQFKKDTGFVVTEIEIPFINALGYAGTPDRKGYFKQHPEVDVLLDIKTGSAIPEYASVQLAAYAYDNVPGPLFAKCRRIAWQPRLGAYPQYHIREWSTETIQSDFAKFAECLRRMQ